MTNDALSVFILILITIVLFVSGKVRLDVTAILVMVVLAVAGILPVRDVVAGFGSTLVIMIAALFVVGEGLFRTGVASRLGRLIARVAGKSEIRLLAILMPSVAILSAFMSSTGAVALFIPIILSLARHSGISKSRVLMPIAFSGLIGGMLTLIGTPPNLAVSTELQRSGLAPFGFFDFTPIGFAVLVVGMLYILFVGRKMLPDINDAQDLADHRSLREMARVYGFEEQLRRVRIRAGSELVGKTVFDLGLRKNFGMTVVGVERHKSFMHSMRPVLEGTRFEAGDFLILATPGENLALNGPKLGLIDEGFPDDLHERFQQQFGIAETIVIPNSPLIGKTIAEGNFRKRQELSVLSLRRGSETLAFDFSETRIQSGDILFVAGTWDAIKRLSGPRKDMMLLETPLEVEDAFPQADKAPFAITITLSMLVLMIFNIMPSVTAVLCGALAMVLTGCVRMEEAYSTMNWQSLILIAGMLPLSTALQVTGGADLIVQSLVGQLGDLGPMTFMAALFILTSVLSQFISNTATAVLVAPIALASAHLLGVNPEGFMMALAIAASTAFATPVASPVNTLVLGPGQYRFFDFARVGIPLQILAMVVTLLLVPVFFPFYS